MTTQVGLRVVAVDEASRTLRNVDNAVDDLDRNVRNSSRSASLMGMSFEDAWTSVAGGIGIVTAAAAAVGAIAAQGEAVADVAVKYRTYTDALDENGDLLERLREVSLGVVKDTELMEAAANAYVFAGARSEEQILRLVRAGSQLGGGAEGVQALFAALKNGVASIELLDNVGISAANVRRRMAELEDQVADTDERFRLAVMAEADASLDQFGDALAEQASALDRFSVDAQNAMDNVTLAFRDGVNSIIEAVYAARDAVGEMQQRDQEWIDTSAELTSYILNNNRELAASFEQGFGAEGNQRIFDYFRRLNEATFVYERDTGVVVDSTERVIAALEYYTGQSGITIGANYAPLVDAFLGMQYDMEQAASEAFNAALTTALENLSVGGTAFGELEGILGDGMFGSPDEINRAQELIDSYRDTLEQAASDFEAGIITEAEFNMLAQLEPTVDGYQQRIREANIQLQLHEDITRGVGRAWDEAQSFISDALAVAEQYTAGDQLMMDIGNQATTIASVFDSMGLNEIDGITLFTEDTFNQITTLEQQFNGMVARAQEMNQLGFISDDELATISTTADEVKRMADEAERGRDALNDMSLDQLLGVSDGGAAGEITDRVIAAAREAGVSETRIAAFEQMMGLQSGRVTEESLAFERDILPGIIATLQGNFTGTGPYQEFGADAAAEQAMAALNQLGTTAAGIPVEWGTEGFTAITDNVTTPLTDAQTAVTDISDRLMELSSTPQQVTVELDIRTGDNLETLAAALMPYINRATTDRGETSDTRRRERNR